METSSSSSPSASTASPTSVKVLCLGLSRTGTLSLRSVFTTLGYTGIYHYRVPAIEQPSHSTFWAKFLRAKYESSSPNPKLPTRADFDSIYTPDYEVITDSPSVFFWRELLDAYPDAKVILQSRPMHRWSASHMRTVSAFNIEFFGPRGLSLYKWLYQFLRPRGDFWEFSRVQAVYGHGIGGRGDLERRFVRHYEEVRRECERRGREVLEYDVAEGWEPLCGFLGREVPEKEKGKGEEFPRLNDARAFEEEWRPVMGEVRKGIHRRMVVLAVGLVGGVAGLMLWSDGRLDAGGSMEVLWW